MFLSFDWKWVRQFILDSLNNYCSEYSKGNLESKHRLNTMVAVEILKQSFRMAEYISKRKVLFQFLSNPKQLFFCSQRLYLNKDLILNPFPAAGTPCFTVLTGQKDTIWGHRYFAVQGCDDSLAATHKMLNFATDHLKIVLFIYKNAEIAFMVLWSLV